MAAPTGSESATRHPGPARERDARRRLPLAFVGLSMAPRGRTRSSSASQIFARLRLPVQFVAAMQRIDITGGPRPGAHNFGRGVPLAIRDADTRAAIAKLQRADTDAVSAAWDEASQAPASTVLPSDPWRPPCWQPAGRPRPSKRRHRLRRLGRRRSRCDFVAAWTLFSGESRDAFRAALSIDDASRARSRGWALSTGLIALPYYLDTNPVIVAMARHQIEEVLADRKRTC